MVKEKKLLIDRVGRLQNGIGEASRSVFTFSPAKTASPPVDPNSLSLRTDAFYNHHIKIKNS